MGSRANVYAHLSFSNNTLAQIRSMGVSQSAMRIKNLTLKNFRKFDEFHIDFHSDLTAIVALNGQGKTSILEGVAIAIGPFFSHIENSSSKHIDKNDVRRIKAGSSYNSETKYPVEVTANFDIPKICSSRFLRSPKSKTTIKESKELSDFGYALVEDIWSNTDEQKDLPVICYYPSNRLWSLHRATASKQNTLSKSRTLGYIDCLSRSSNFSQVAEWLRSATLASLQYRGEIHFDTSLLPRQLEAVSDAVNTVLVQEGWSNFHYSVSLQELAMVHEDQGLLPTSFLSDGLRAIISLVADLAWRCAQLNSHLGSKAATDSSGIVLIDEVDLHLHPSWQQRILSTLKSAFPNIQFIVTTHSPQVISTADKTTVRVIESQFDARDNLHFYSREPEKQTSFTRSSDILAEVFSVNPLPASEISEKLSTIHRTIQMDLGNNQLIEDLRRELIQHYGKNHQFIHHIDALIRFKLKKQQIQSRLNK